MLTLLGVEFGILYRKQTLTAAIHAFIHTLLWGITLFVLVLCITEVTKPYAGRLRPDFMDRCNPVAAQRAGVLDPFELADCQNKEGEEIHDGRLSFPSGHSSNSMSICFFGTIYMAYSMFWRGGRSFMDSIHGHDNMWMRVLMEIVYPILFFLNLMVFLCAWFIGVRAPAGGPCILAAAARSQQQQCSSNNNCRSSLSSSLCGVPDQIQAVVAAIAAAAASGVMLAAAMLTSAAVKDLLAPMWYTRAMLN
jgi:hypothetical protein